MRRILSVMAPVSALVAAAMLLSSCGETAGTGEDVTIPPVYVDCRTAQCKSIVAPNPTIIVIFSTSGCVDEYISYGGTISGSTRDITCSSSLGCYGQITSWIDASGNAVTKMPSGVYSVCGIIDAGAPTYPSPPASGEDVKGELANVSVVEGTANQFITNWEDQ